MPAGPTQIWKFILAENRASRFHFEIAADLLTEENFQLLARAPAGIFRFEIGVQSGDDEVLARVGRKCDQTRLFANVRRLREETGVIVHLDLVAGLPGEDFPGFLGSLQKIFDALGSGATGGGSSSRAPYDLTGNNADNRSFPACHIQVEPLKVLKGSPMRKIAAEENYAYSATPPYKVLRTPWLSFAEICRIETISRLIDLIYNSGKFRTVLTLIAGTLPLSRFFATAAKQWEDAETLPNLSQPELFETLWRCAAGFLPERRTGGVPRCPLLRLLPGRLSGRGQAPRLFRRGRQLAAAWKRKGDEHRPQATVGHCRGEQGEDLQTRFCKGLSEHSLD